MSKYYKTREMLFDEVEQLEERLSLSEQYVDYYVHEYNVLVKQKFLLVMFLKEHQCTHILNKIKEIEHDTTNSNR